ncbi:MAG: tetratricopeptide repeat protein [Candidatus Omnitrophota bacterium]
MVSFSNHSIRTTRFQSGCLAIILAAFFVYFLTTFYNVTFFDDQFLLTYPWRLSHWGDFAHLFLSPDMASNVFYRPLLNLSFYLNAALNQDSIWLYRVFNLLIHSFAGCLVFALLLRLRTRYRMALLLSLIFAVHPAIAEAVVWIPGRTDSLLTVFLLLSFLKLASWARPAGRSFDFFLSCCFLSAALLTKETAVVAPFVFLVYFFTIRKSFSTARVIFAVTAWIGILTVYFLVRMLALGIDSGIAGTSVWTSFLQNLPTVLIYLGKWFFPYKLSVFPVLENANYLSGIVVMLTLFCLLWTLEVLRNKKRACFAAVWFLSFIVIGLPLSTAMHEYRLYLPSVGLLLVIASFPFLLRIPVRIFWGMGVGIVFLLAMANMDYSKLYANPLVFWSHAVMDAPDNAFVHNNLGAVYGFRKDLMMAEHYYKRAIEINPNEPLVHGNLANVYLARQSLDMAVEEYIEELRVVPTSYSANFSLGSIFYTRGDMKRAVIFLERASQINPDNKNCSKLLSQALLELK